MIKLKYIKPRSQYHKDILLTINDIKIFADSYYLIRPLYPLGKEYENQIKCVIVEMLDCWINTIEKYISSKGIFLLYEYSDEYLGGFYINNSELKYVYITKFIELEYKFSSSISKCDFIEKYNIENFKVQEFTALLRENKKIIMDSMTI